MDKLWGLLDMVIRGLAKKASCIVSLDGRDWEATVYVIPAGERPVYRIDLGEVKK